MERLVIDQILPTVTYGDAVSNEAFAIMAKLKAMGFESRIFAQYIDPRVKRHIKPIKRYRAKGGNSLLIHHFSIGSQVNEFVAGLRGVRKIMIYHNITPEHFFYGYNKTSSSLSMLGRRQLKRAVKTYEVALADSEYNRRELESLGYENTHVLPIICNWDNYSRPADQKVLNKFLDGKTNLLFVGRIAPNKRQEDIIKVFYYYKRYIDPDSRLFLVGTWEGMEKYRDRLAALVNSMDLTDVYFTGRVSFSELLAYYRISSVFVCMSEHEGFCVPLLESMYFRLPILAYHSSSVPETMGRSGVIVYKKDFALIAEMVNMMVSNKELRKKLIASQDRRLKDFDMEASFKKLRHCIDMMVGVHCHNPTQ